MTREPFILRKKRVFESVFRTPVISQPTPVATPVTGFTAAGQAFGGPLSLDSTRFPNYSVQESNLRTPEGLIGVAGGRADHVRDQAHWDRSWHTVTLLLVIPGVPSDHDFVEAWELRSVDAGFSEALKDLLDPQTRLPFATHVEDIIAWNNNQLRQHFLQQVLPVLKTFEDLDSGKLLLRVFKFLEIVQGVYINRLTMIDEEVVLSRGFSDIVPRFLRDLYGIINNSIAGKLSIPLKSLSKERVFDILGLPSPMENSEQKFELVPESNSTEEARNVFLQMVTCLQQVGLAGEAFQVIFAEVMNDAMSAYVYLGCKGIWSKEDLEAGDCLTVNSHPATNGRKGSTLPRNAHHAFPSQCAFNLCEWIENRYAKLAVQVFSILDSAMPNQVKVTWTQVEKWKEMGIRHLAELRINELFEIVAQWPHSSCALDDLRTAITTPQRRLHLTDVFVRTLNKKLLHPGASTLQILQTYISMISSFHSLDHSKVLLDRVAYPLQLYLCSREDTVRIIITGLLSDTEDSQGNPVRPGGDRLVELAGLLHKGEEQSRQRANDEELDWHDMDWQPDPSDAGPGYKRSKSADIIGTLIGALGSQDVFIKEFQNIIGEHLLKNDGSFEKEVSLPLPYLWYALSNTLQSKVLNLLKVRFGEASLQGCEVMLKDIQDSARVNVIVRGSEQLDPSDEEINIAKSDSDIEHTGDVNPEGLLKPSLHAKILSRLFWPQLHDESHRIPDEIVRLQRLYERGFENLKSSRKLTWLHALGQATVELELTDRKIVEEVHTWQASVIWAFQSDEVGGGAVRRSVQELTHCLEMEEPLVRNALKFWANKLVLQEIEKDVFSVLETLNQEDRDRSNAQAAASAAAAADESTDETALMADNGITPENAQMYWQFIQGMLKNSSRQMPLQQIATMLRMLIADGFPYSNEELQLFLGRKIADGELEFAGGKYRLKKA
jgi:anaphase-promoting complex subunit 2